MAREKVRQHRQLVWCDVVGLISIVDRLVTVLQELRTLAEFPAGGARRRFMICNGRVRVIASVVDSSRGFPEKSSRLVFWSKGGYKFLDSFENGHRGRDDYERVGIWHWHEPCRNGLGRRGRLVLS